MKVIYCENCGACLEIKRKAMPTYGRIIDLVPYHECSDEIIPFDMSPNPVPTFMPNEEKQKFVEKLNELQPQKSPFGIDTRDLRDQRKIEDVKSTAPLNLLNSINQMPHGQPTGDINNEPEGE